MLELPRITYYARVRSNLNGQLLTDWKFFDETTWFYGKCNSLEGSESQYIIELDIWNNEPSFNAGTYDIHCKTAYNCQVGIAPLNEENIDLFKAIPFLYGRCYTNNVREEWEPITISSPLTNIYGTSTSQKQVLVGNADHMLIQTKIIMPPNDILNDYTRYPFNVTFMYETL